MYLVMADVSEAKMRYKRTKVLEILEQFKESGFECARVVDHNYAEAKSGVNAFRKAIHRFGINGVEVCIRNGEIYLVRVDM